MRPWVTPDEVRAHSEHPAAAKRSTAALAGDIARAEAWVVAYTGNAFEEGPPEDVRLAAVLLAERYAAIAVAAAGGGRISRESFDDYTYAVFDDGPGGAAGLELAPLLAPYKRGAAVTMRGV